MRLASLITWSVTVLLLLAARGSSSIRTPERGSASRVEIPGNEYGPEVIEDKDLYLQTAADTAPKELVELQEEIFGIRLDIRYATESNFVGEQLYPVAAKAVLRRPAAESLTEMQEELGGQGLGPKVFDGYRPYEVTERMWEPHQDPVYVADPVEGPRHDRGCAVDLTLVDGNGEELLMPPNFDNSSERTGHGYEDLSEDAIRNRDLLREVIKSHGFVALEYVVVALRLAGLRAVRVTEPPAGERAVV